MKVGHAGNVKKRLDCNIGEHESNKRDLEYKESALKEKSRNSGHLDVELGVVTATISR